MFKSIRGKFLAWLSLVLLLVIGGFGASLHLLVKRSRLAEVDAELRGTAQVLAQGLRSRRPPPPPGGGRKKGGRPPEFGDFEGREKHRPPYPHDDPRDDRRGRGPPPRGAPSLQDHAARIELPEALLRQLEDEGDRHDFAIWSVEGDLL